MVGRVKVETRKKVMGTPMVCIKKTMMKVTQCLASIPQFSSGNQTRKPVAMAHQNSTLCD